MNYYFSKMMHEINIYKLVMNRKGVGIINYIHLQCFGFYYIIFTEELTYINSYFIAWNICYI